MNLEQIYAQIEEQRNILVRLLNQSAKNPVSPNRLSDICTKLAILNGLLGDKIPGLKSDQLEAEKTAYNAAKASGTSDTGANSVARMSTVEQRLAFETADIKHTDLWKLISMAQSHIRAEGDERKAG